MAPYNLILALLIQSTLTYAYSNKFDDADTRELLKQVPEFDNMIKDGEQKDWIDMFIGQTNGLYPSTSAALMAHAISPNKTPEEQVENIKDMAHEITKAIQSEMTNLLSYAIAHCEKGEEGKQTKHKRSIETPLDSSQLVMRLLKHIKANNEHQNIAIEKMMTAQEIANKYGVKYIPDEDLLTDLVDYSSQQAEQLSSVLTAAYNTNNNQVEFVPLKDIKEDRENAAENSTYYIYALHIPEDGDEVQSQLNSFPSYEYMPEQVQYMYPVSPAHYGASHPQQTHYKVPETQIQAPPAHHTRTPAPVCQRPPFYANERYEPAFTPAPAYRPPCNPMEPITTTTTIVLPVEEPVTPEPELAGQVYEETVSNKVIIEKGEEPGSTDVNHVMTYSVSEKSHFKTPEIEKLPQQMQYYFFLMN